MKKLFIISALLLASSNGWVTGAHAGETFLLLEDTEDLPPPYMQWWYATASDHIVFEGTHEVYIRGDGKHGDFFGVLQVDCRNAENSEWLATGGWLDSESIPSRAIANLRYEICR